MGHFEITAGTIGAIARDKKTGRDVILSNKGIGKLAGTRTAPILPGMAVKKLGRTTGVTKGKVSAIEVDKVVVDHDLGSLSFDNQIEIEVGRQQLL